MNQQQRELLEELLTQYEDLWTEAMLADRRQFHLTQGNKPGVYPRAETGTAGSATCAWLLGTLSMIARTAQVYALWVCPLCSHWRNSEVQSLTSILIHLNNDHQWTWDQLARKAREVIFTGFQKGEAP